MIEINSDADIDLVDSFNVDLTLTESDDIDISVNSGDAEIDFATEDDNNIDISVEPLNFEMSVVIDDGTLPTVLDYRELINKPKINNTELYDNYNEIDPTVPSWAKATTKPNYTANEVGALDKDSEMSWNAIKSVWDSVFNN